MPDPARLTRTEPERGSGDGLTFPGGRLITCLIAHVPQPLGYDHYAVGVKGQEQV
jgi:hypothetical protein